MCDGQRIFSIAVSLSPTTLPLPPLAPFCLGCAIHSFERYLTPYYVLGMKLLRCLEIIVDRAEKSQSDGTYTGGRQTINQLRN